MSGWGTWANEPDWMHETTWEWEPLPGQRYPGDPGRGRTGAARGIGRPDVGPGPQGYADRDPEDRRPREDQRPHLPAEHDRRDAPAVYGTPGHARPLPPPPPPRPAQHPEPPQRPAASTGPATPPSGPRWAPPAPARRGWDEPARPDAPRRGAHAAPTGEHPAYARHQPFGPRPGTPAGPPTPDHPHDRPSASDRTRPLRPVGSPGKPPPEGTQPIVGRSADPAPPATRARPIGEDATRRIVPPSRPPLPLPRPPGDRHGGAPQYGVTRPDLPTAPVTPALPDLPAAPVTPALPWTRADDPTPGVRREPPATAPITPAGPSTPPVVRDVAAPPIARAAPAAPAPVTPAVPRPVPPVAPPPPSPTPPVAPPPPSPATPAMPPAGGNGSPPPAAPVSAGPAAPTSPGVESRDGNGWFDAKPKPPAATEAAAVGTTGEVPESGGRTIPPAPEATRDLSGHVTAPDPVHDAPPDVAPGRSLGAALAALLADGSAPRLPGEAPSKPDVPLVKQEPAAEARMPAGTRPEADTAPDTAPGPTAATTAAVAPEAGTARGAGAAADPVSEVAAVVTGGSRAEAGATGAPGDAAVLAPEGAAAPEGQAEGGAPPQGGPQAGAEAPAAAEAAPDADGAPVTEPAPGIDREAVAEPAPGIDGRAVAEPAPGVHGEAAPGNAVGVDSVTGAEAAIESEADGTRTPTVVPDAGSSAATTDVPTGTDRTATTESTTEDATEDAAATKAAAGAVIAAGSTGEAATAGPQLSAEPTSRPRTSAEQIPATAADVAAADPMPDPSVGEPDAQGRPGGDPGVRAKVGSGTGVLSSSDSPRTATRAAPADGITADGRHGPAGDHGGGGEPGGGEPDRFAVPAGDVPAGAKQGATGREGTGFATWTGTMPGQRARLRVPPEGGGAAASADTVLPAPDSVAGAATALRAPTVLAQVVTPRDRPAPAQRGSRIDPEQYLGSYPWRFHPETLREIVDDADELRAVRDRLTAKLEAATIDAARARLLGLRAVVSRILGDLAPALADGRDALAIAERIGELRRTAIVQARLAHVLQWRGDFAEADRLFEEANSPELPDRLRATMHEHAGRSCYDQGRYIEACIHSEKALDLRKVEDPELIARTELALDAVMARVAQSGWGPYPRTREEILRLRQPPAPAFSARAQRWGYRETDGSVAVPPRYADVQPFHDDLAWVRRPESRAWELIDTDGETVVEAAARFVGANSFSDGLAWVTRDGHGWFAIDRTGRTVIPTLFDDVRPFRRGLAAVRRGGWGAVDRTGRMVVPPRYAGLVTALTDGRYVDGFTDEGLAVVDTVDGKGVVDRQGRVVVSPRHPELVIHPVAFLVGDGSGRWGALDRRGEPLIDVVHASRGDVADQIDRLLADTYPLL